MANQRVSRYQIEERQVAVDTLDVLGFQRAEIFKKLGDKYYQGHTYANPGEILASDLRKVRAKRKRLLLNGDKRRALEEFIAQQIEIFKRAMVDKKYREAMDATVNILKARGVEFEQIPHALEIVFGNKTTVVKNNHVNILKILEQKDASGRSFAEEWREVYRRANATESVS